MQECKKNACNPVISSLSLNASSSVHSINTPTNSNDNTAIFVAVFLGSSTLFGVLLGIIGTILAMQWQQRYNETVKPRVLIPMIVSQSLNTPIRHDTETSNDNQTTANHESIEQIGNQNLSFSRGPLFSRS